MVTTRGYMRLVSGQDALKPPVAGSTGKCDDDIWRNALVIEDAARGSATIINVDLSQRTALAGKTVEFCEWLVRACSEFRRSSIPHFAIYTVDLSHTGIGNLDAEKLISSIVKINRRSGFSKCSQTNCPTLPHLPTCLAAGTWTNSTCRIIILGHQPLPASLRRLRPPQTTSTSPYTPVGQFVRCGCASRTTRFAQASCARRFLYTRGWTSRSAYAPWIGIVGAAPTPADVSDERQPCTSHTCAC